MNYLKAEMKGGRVSRGEAGKETDIGKHPSAGISASRQGTNGQGMATSCATSLPWGFSGGVRSSP